MKKHLVTLLTVCLPLYLPSLAWGSQCPTGNTITEPNQFQWTHHPVSANNPTAYYSGTLEMGSVTLNVNGETLTTRAYRQEGTNYTIPGPTLGMVPGNKYVLRFKNTLPYQPASSAHNVYKDPNVTNVHTHGLHISGESPSDDVTRFFEGGFGGDFVYDIPADHMGGTYWYHAHHHGSTFLQVSSGAFGQIIIDDQYDQIPQNVADMEEKSLTIAYLDPSVAGTGGDALVSGTLQPGWTVNGKVTGDICMPPNTWQHWRILLADANAIPKTVNIGEQCEVALMARDGVWRTQVPKAIPTNSLTLTGASRADLAIRCSGDATISVGNTQVASIYTDGTADPSVHPYAADGSSQWASYRPSYLRDLRNVAVSNFERINMGARTVNGVKFDVDVPTLTTNADGVQEWDIKGAGNHPFHLHVYHFQAQTDCGDYEAGEYYDVIASSCKVRFDLNPQTSTVFSGRTIMHCHILEHEDQGAMGWMDVIGGEPAPTFPYDADIIQTYEELYQLGGGPAPTTPAAPANLVAVSTSSSNVNITWQDNATDEDGFQLERSIDGLDFTVIATPVANDNSYADSGLNAATTYYYRINAENAAGSSTYSNVATVTTQPGSEPGTMVTVSSITVGTQGIGGGRKKGTATIVVHDDAGNPVAGATVQGQFTGSINEMIASSPATSSNGQTTVATSQTAKGKLALDFCVTAISHPTLQDFSAAPGEHCGAL